MKQVFITSFVVYPAISAVFIGDYHDNNWTEIIGSYLQTFINFVLLTPIIFFPWLALAYKLSKVYEDLGVGTFLIIPALVNSLFWHFIIVFFWGGPLLSLSMSWGSFVGASLPGILSLVCYCLLCKFDDKKKA